MTSYRNICWKNYTCKEREDFLIKQRNAFINKLTRLIGDRRSEYEIVDSIVADIEGPIILFPMTKPDVKQIAIGLSANAMESQRSERAEWQLSHECLHLFDPSGKPAANFLEEGIATWFQMTIRGHDMRSTKPEYISAHNTVQKYIRNRNLLKHGGLLAAVKMLRNNGHGKKISQITSYDLSSHVAGMTDPDARLLAEKVS